MGRNISGPGSINSSAKCPFARADGADGAANTIRCRWSGLNPGVRRCKFVSWSVEMGLFVMLTACSPFVSTMALRDVVVEAFVGALEHAEGGIRNLTLERD